MLIIFTIAGYVEELFVELVRAVTEQIDFQCSVHLPPPLSSSFYHPDKDEAIKEHQSRFSLVFFCDS